MFCIPAVLTSGSKRDGKGASSAPKLLSPAGVLIELGTVLAPLARSVQAINLRLSDS
jgi:hypothetical protein